MADGTDLFAWLKTEYWLIALGIFGVVLFACFAVAEVVDGHVVPTVGFGGLAVLCSRNTCAGVSRWRARRR